MLMQSALGIDFGGTNIKWGIVAEDGQVLKEGSEPTESRRGPDVLLNKLSVIVAEALSYSYSLNIKLKGVGN